MASPAANADTQANIGNELIVSTHAILPCMRWNDPAFLQAKEDDGCSPVPGARPGAVPVPPAPLFIPQQYTGLNDHA